MALWAADDYLTVATRCVNFYFLNIALKHHHPFCFNQGVEGKRGPGLPLAPAAVTTVNNKRIRGHLVPNVATGAAAFMSMVVSHYHSPFIVSSPVFDNRWRSVGKLEASLNVLCRKGEYSEYALLMKYQFSDFTLDPGKFELKECGSLVAVEPLVFELLLLLFENRD